MPLTVSAQLTELWRTELMNSPGRSYTLVEAAMSQSGDLIVGGAFAMFGSGNEVRSALVASFDPEGKKKWEQHIGEWAVGGVDALSLDLQGNIFFTCSVPGALEDPSLLTLVKLSPDGEILWQAEEPEATYRHQHTGTSALVTDQAGNVFWAGYLDPRLPAGSGGVFLSKYSPEGSLLWRSVGPPARYGLGLGGMHRCLALAPNGDLVLAVSTVLAEPTAGENWKWSGMILRFNPDGELKQVLDSASDAAFLGKVFSSVYVQDDGRLCAASVDGFVIVSASGTVLGSRGRYDGGNVVGPGPEGGFVIQPFWGQAHALAAHGSVAWRTPATGQASAGLAVLNGGEGICVLARNLDGPNGMQLPALSVWDADGNRRFRAWLPGYDYNERMFGDRRPNGVLQAPDGSLRIVVNHLSQAWPPLSDGIAIGAFRMEPLPPGWPRIRTAPQDVHWDGKSDVVLRVEAEGEGELKYQWQSDQVPLAGATGPTLVLPASELPANRWRWSARVSNAIGETVSRAVDVILGRPVMAAKKTDYGSMGVTVHADPDVQFRLEQSSDLLNWMPVPNVNSASPHTLVVPEPDGKLFFRAVEER